MTSRSPLSKALGKKQGGEGGGSYLTVTVLPPGVLISYVSEEYKPFVVAAYVTLNGMLSPGPMRALWVANTKAASQSDSTRRTRTEVFTCETLRTVSVRSALRPTRTSPKVSALTSVAMNAYFAIPRSVIVRWMPLMLHIVVVTYDAASRGENVAVKVVDSCGPRVPCAGEILKGVSAFGIPIVKLNGTSPIICEGGVSLNY